MTPEPPTPTLRGFSFRWTVCALVFVATTINYMDRQVLGLLAATLERKVGWSEIDYSRIIMAGSAYLLALAIAQALSPDMEPAEVKHTRFQDVKQTSLRHYRPALRHPR